MSEHFRQLRHAEALLDLGRPAEAEDRLRAVLASDPEHAVALLILARALHEQDRDAEAESAARSGLALDPDNADGLLHLCDILCARKDATGALEAARRAALLEPHDWRTHYAVARAFMVARRPRTREAYDAARRSVELAPHSAAAHNLLGICLSNLGDEPGAQQAFRNALALDPQHTLAQNNLAASEIDSGRLRRAAGMLRSAVGNAPQEKLLHQNLDTVLLMLGRRIMWSLFAAALVLGILLAAQAPWWTRALAGTAYVVVLVRLVRGVLTHLPRGVSSWGRGLFGRVKWQGKYLLGLLALLSVGVLLLALAPYPVAVGAALVLASVLRIVGLACLVGWVVMAGVNLVRGR